MVDAHLVSTRTDLGLVNESVLSIMEKQTTGTKNWMNQSQPRHYDRVSNLQN